MAKTAQKHPAVTAFKECRILDNAQKILDLVQLQGGDYKNITGLSHTLFNEAVYLVVNKAPKVRAAFQDYQNEPGCGNAKKILKLINKGDSMSSDFGIPDKVMAQIMNATISKTSQRKLALRK